ncbi:MAG: peptidase T, partial [Rikenellaceae bacterium]|nr:peptidase T [Rikenellaceae bacterium]
MDKLTERFLGYVAVDTQSDAKSTSFPSTPSQTLFMERLADELRMMGLSSVEVDDNGYLMAWIESNTDKPAPSIGFIAHVDTSPDLSGKDVRPRVVLYHGGDITLGGTTVMTEERFPELKLYHGKHLIVTDGTTLLGADDKAGVAEIMTAVEHILAHPERPHGRVCIAFTPDEEIGHGVDRFDVARFGADYAYTIDGGRLGMIEHETFNAASAVVEVHGVNVHPGYAKGKMHNALRILAKFDSLLPDQRPENTEGYEGFFHLVAMKGGVERAAAEYLIRDHDRSSFEARKLKLKEIAASLSAGDGVVSVKTEDQYYNMGEVLAGDNYRIVERAIESMRRIGIEPIITPVRGGTDGARLSFM